MPTSGGPHSVASPRRGPARPTPAVLRRAAGTALLAALAPHELEGRGPRRRFSLRDGPCGRTKKRTGSAGPAVHTTQPEPLSASSRSCCNSGAAVAAGEIVPADKAVDARVPAPAAGRVPARDPARALKGRGTPPSTPRSTLAPRTQEAQRRVMVRGVRSPRGVVVIGLEGCGHAKAGGAARAQAPAAPPAEIDVTLFLIGDAGGQPAAHSEPVFLALRAAAASATAPPSSYSGRQCSTERMPRLHPPPPQPPRALTTLGSSRRAAPAVLRATIHDWDGMRPAGGTAIRRESGSSSAAGAALLPAGGCPDRSSWTWTPSSGSWRRPSGCRRDDSRTRRSSCPPADPDVIDSVRGGGNTPRARVPW